MYINLPFPTVIKSVGAYGTVGRLSNAWANAGPGGAGPIKTSSDGVLQQRKVNMTCS